VKLRMISREIIGCLTPKCCNLLLMKGDYVTWAVGTDQWHHPVETHSDSVVVVQPNMIIIVQVAKKYPKSSLGVESKISLVMNNFKC